MPPSSMKTCQSAMDSVRTSAFATDGADAGGSAARSRVRGSGARPSKRAKSWLGTGLAGRAASEAVCMMATRKVAGFWLASLIREIRPRFQPNRADYWSHIERPGRRAGGLEIGPCAGDEAGSFLAARGDSASTHAACEHP